MEVVELHLELVVAEEVLEVLEELEGLEGLEELEVLEELDSELLVEDLDMMMTVSKTTDSELAERETMTV